MSDKLWLYFQKYIYLLNGLFEASSNAILSWFYELNKFQNFKVVRYYGLYAREHKHSSKIFKLLNQTQIGIREQLTK